MKKKSKTTKKNPADTTMRNINALKKKLESVDRRLGLLALIVKEIVIGMGLSK